MTFWVYVRFYPSCTGGQWFPSLLTMYVYINIFVVWNIIKQDLYLFHLTPWDFTLLCRQSRESVEKDNKRIVVRHSDGVCIQIPVFTNFERNSLLV